MSTDMSRGQVRILKFLFEIVSLKKLVVMLLSAPLLFSLYVLSEASVITVFKLKV